MEEVIAICDILNMPEGQLPIRYLSIPLQSRGLRCAEYHPLLRKLMEKIQSWDTKHLSYAGRLCLIQSVLKSISRFWCHIFFLPKEVINQVQKLCRSFLWTGDIQGHKHHVLGTDEPRQIAWWPEY